MFSINRKKAHKSSITSEGSLYCFLETLTNKTSEDMHVVNFGQHFNLTVFKKLFLSKVYTLKYFINSINAYCY